MMKHIYNLFNKTLIIFTALAISGNAFAAWSGSGQGVNKSGTWYVLYEDSEASISAFGTKSYTLSGPGASLTFQAKRQTAGTGKLQVTDNDNNSVFNNSLSTSYASKSGTVKNSATSLSFYNGGTLKKYVKLVRVTMAQYLNNPTKTDLDCGTADINTDPTSGQVNVAWCNVPAMSYSITGTDKDLFSVSVSNNSEAGKYNTATFTVTYKHKKAGTHSASLKITDTYGSYSKTVNLSGTTNKLTPTVTWSPDDNIFNVDDVLSATNRNLTVELSGNSTYVTCSGNTATMKAATSGTIEINAHVTGNDIYADADIKKTITITNLEKQHITWTQDLAHLKTNAATKTITLNATSSSGLPVSYELVGDKTGLTLNKSGNTWTLAFTVECKNTTIVAKQAGNATYAPASNVSLPVKVIDPTKVCDASETLVNTGVELKNTSTTYNIDIPSTMTIKVERIKTGMFDWYTNGFDVEFYSGQNGTGTKIGNTYEYGASDISNSKTISLSNLAINAKSVKLISHATYGYRVTSVTYTHQKYHNLSGLTNNTLSFSTSPSTTTSAKTFKVNYAHYPITLECTNPKFTVTPTEFGDCGEYGSETISVKYTAGASEGTDNGYIYVKDNTGTTLETCTLAVSIQKVPQSITSNTIQSSYKTTDVVTLSAVVNSGLTTGFTYSATPAGIAQFDGAQISFIKDGKIDITIHNAGDNTYAPTELTIYDVQVNKVTPTLTPPTIATGLVYDPNEKVEDHWTGGSAKDDKNNPVAGTYHCTEILQPAKNATGYTVTFKPTNTNWYTENTAVIKQNVAKADQTINWALVNGTECQTGTSLAGATATSGQTVTYISGNTDIATIDANNKLVVVVANQDVQIIARQVGDANWNSVDSVRTIRTVGAQPNDMSAVSATNLTYGQSLHASTISGNVKLNGVVIAGSLAWTDPTIVPEVGNNQPFEITFTPSNTNAYAVTRFNVNINVAKATPVLTWHIGNAIREKSTYRIPVSSSNTETQLNVEVIAGSSIASWTENGLVIGALTGNATSTTIKLRITQDGNNNYNAITPVEKTITVEKKYSVCVPVVFDKDSYSNAAASTDGNVGWCDTNENGSAKFWNMFNVTYTQHKGIYLGGWDEGLSLSFGSNFNIHYTEKYVVLSINGVPDRIKFTTVAQTVTAIGIDFPQTSPKWRIEESSNGTNWTSIYEGTAQEFTADQELVHSTRYVKVTYGGNFTGFLKDIEITRQHYLRADKSSLTFGTAEHPLQTPQELTLSYSSIGSCENPQGYIDLEIDNPAFYVDEQRITQNVNFDQYDSYKVYVRCTDINQTGTLTITGSDGTTTSVALSSENIEITPANASTNLIYTGTEHAALNNTPYRGMQPLHFTNCFDNGTALFDSLYIYGVTDNINQTVATVQGNDYKIPTFTVTNGTTTGTAHTPCYVYAKNGNKYTYTRSFDAANTAQEIDAPAEKLWFGGYKPAAITNAAVRVSGNGGTRTDLYLDNVDMNNGEAVILAQNNSGAEAFTLALHAEGTNKIASNAAAAMQIGAAKGQIVIEDSWCNATSAMLTLNPASGKPSIELGSAQNAVVVNGTQLSLKNGNPLAIAYTRNGVEQTIGSVIINDGTIIGETELHFPEATRIYGGTFNDGQVRAYTAQGLTYPTNDVGERLLRKSMDKASLPPYYGQAHLTLDNILKVNPILKDEHIYVFNEDGDWDDSDNWDVDEVPGFNADVIINSNVNVVGDITVNNITIAENKDVTVVDGASLTINGTTGNSAPFGNIIVEAGGQLILGNGAVNVNDFTLYSNFQNEQPKSGQVSNPLQLTTHGEAYFILDLDPSGSASYGWYSFTVPFPVDAMQGVYRLDNGNWVKAVNEVNYAIMDYHEDLRAQGKYGWKKYRSILQPGTGYLMTVENALNTYRFTKTQGGNFNTAMTQTLTVTDGDEKDKGWNSIGNGTTSYVTYASTPRYAQLYNHSTNAYDIELTTGNALVVGAAYFVQATTNNSTITMQDASDATTGLLRAPQRDTESDICFVNLSLSANGKSSDKLFVTCDDNAAATYTIGKDVMKMGATTGISVARIWANAKGTTLGAADVAYNGNEAIIPLGIYAPKDGEYTLSLNSNPMEYVYLTRNGVIVWNLSMSDYTFTLEAGSDTSYALQVVRRVQNTATGVDAIDNDKRGTDFVEKMIVNGQLLILRDGILYDAQGKKVSTL